TDNSTDEEGFQIERAPDSAGSPGNWASIATVATSAYNDTGLSPNSTYWYRVRAYNAFTNSASTAQVSGTTFLPAILNVSPATLDFGAVLVGLSTTQTFSIINSGQSTLIGTTTVGTPFAVASNSSYTVLMGQTGTVTVVFAPSLAGGVTNSIIFSSNGG